MINQATSIIAEALLYSLLAGAVAYIVLRVLLALLKNIPSLIKYHLCNISLLIPLLVFILSLTKLTTVKDTAPVYPTPPPVATIYNNTQDYAAPVQEATVQDSRLTAEAVWAEVNSVIVEHSYTITWLYIAGLLLFSIRLLLQYLQSQQLKTKGLLPATDDWHRLLANTMSRLRINSPIHISFTERKISPCIIGHAKAVILIPISLANHLTTEQAEAILLHELAHYKQYDHYINLGVQCIKCLLFFNPFVWLQAILIDKYRELSCDETAAKHERNIELAETLAMIAGIQARQNSLVMSLKKSSPLLARVQALLHIRQYDKSSHRLLPLVVTTIVLATGLLIAGSTKLFSTEKDNLREQLKEISAQMYKEGNHKYVFVDAVLDSLIRLPAKSNVLYMGAQHFSMMGDKGEIKMSVQLRQRYIKKLQLFLLSVGEDKNTPVTYDAIKNHDILTLEDILQRQSSFRTYTAEERYRAGIAKQGWKRVFAELVQDNLVQPGSKNFSMEYSGKGIVINGWKLEGAQETKYRHMLKETVGIDLEKVSGSLSPDDMQQYLGLSGKNNIEKMNTLAEISRLLFADGKIEYILADAMKDGYLRDGDEFTIVMNENDVLFAGVKMTKEHEAQYNDKYRLFREYYVCPDCHGGVTATLLFSDLTDQNSALRKGDFLLSVMSNRRHEKTMRLLAEMHTLGLIDTNYRVDIFYIGNKLYINQSQLSAREADKYIKLIKKHVAPEKNDKGLDTWSVTLNEYKPLPPSVLAKVDYNIFTALPQKEKKLALQHISDDLFNKGLTDYIMVDAVKDGYLKDGESYHISYKDGIVAIKGKTLRPQDQIVYNKKFEEFTLLFESDGWYGNTRSTVKMSDILDPESGLRTKGKDDAMIAHDKAMEAHERAMEVHDKAIAEHEKLFGAIPGSASLQRISEELYQTGYQGYIIADAVHDGYIKDGEYYKVAYNKDGFSIEGVTLPAEVKKRYDDKMEAFIALHKDVKRMHWSISDTFERRKGIKEFKYRITNGQGDVKPQKNKKTFKTSSITLASGSFRVYNSKGSESQMKALVRALHQDKLLDSNSYHVIDYRKDGVFVNARKLTGSYATRYSTMLQAMGDKPSSGIIVEHIPEGVRIPDFYSGDIKVELQTMGANLPGIAELMFVDGNPNFILAHALHDGVLRERQDYNFRFTGGKTYFNDKLLPAPYQAKYTKLMNDFMQAHGHKSDKYITRGDGVTKKQLNTPESPIRKHNINKGRNEKGEYYVDRVIRMMAADGLIDTMQKHKMEYNARGIFVNGKKLSDEQAAKYEAILKEGYGRSPRRTASDGISYSNEP